MARLLTYGAVLNERKENSSVASPACSPARRARLSLATLCFGRHPVAAMCVASAKVAAPKVRCNSF